MLILASSSPRRRALLRAAGVEFRAIAPRAEEIPSTASGRYAHLVKQAALRKAREVARRHAAAKAKLSRAASVGGSRCGSFAPALVLGADTIVVCAGEIMGKPRDEADARRMLRKLSGRWHSVYTGVALVAGSRELLASERTEVAFRRLSKDEIERYLATGEPMGKAGAYAIQGRGAALVRSVRGCYTNVIGLPVPRVLEMLEQCGVGARKGARDARPARR
jgi:septum formation protein